MTFERGAQCGKVGAVQISRVGDCFCKGNSTQETHVRKITTFMLCKIGIKYKAEKVKASYTPIPQGSPPVIIY